MHYLELGGAESALLGLLQTLDSKRVDVDLFLYDKRGELVADIPTWVNVLSQIPKYSMLERPIKELVLKGFWKIAFRRLVAKYRSYRVYKKSGSVKENCSVFYYAIEEAVKSLPPIAPDKEYDLAISFLTPHQIVLDRVKAKKKIGWIHTDYTKIFVDVPKEECMWSRLDGIISISSEVTNTFCNVFPSLNSKIIEIENILSPSYIHKKSEFVSYSIIRKEMRSGEDSFVLLTIGRFCYPKKLEEIPIICKGLIDKGLNVKWFIIGFGDDTQIRENIIRYNVEKNVIILGKRANPYPYIKACDVYVQPSRYEGKSIVVREAQILGKPVIITDYPTARSQVKNGMDGFIVPMGIEDCVNSIYDILINRDNLRRVTEYNANHDFGNESEVEKIYSLIP